MSHYVAFCRQGVIRWRFGAAACPARPGSSATWRPACSRSSYPWQSATNRLGSRQAITTRLIPAAMISCVQVRDRDLRCEQGSRVL